MKATSKIETNDYTY